MKRWFLALWVTAAGALALTGGCFQDGDRWVVPEATGPAATCRVGELRCTKNLEVCKNGADGPAFTVLEDCEAEDRVCAESLLACALCEPGSQSCDGQAVMRCNQEGDGFEQRQVCDTNEGVACRNGACVDLCGQAAEERSNVGCEYWAVDLDNARIDASLDAAAQQFAVVVSNAEPDVQAEVTIERDDTPPGEDNDPIVLTSATVPAFSLTVFKLGPREVDGKATGEETHTAFTRSAYRIKSSVPVVVYQFNPLENVNVFSNDASVLKPVEALVDRPGEMHDAYVALGWPQTIASTDDPETNFSSDTESNLRAFLTIVGTRENTTIQVEPNADIVAGGPIEATPMGETLEVELGPFDVLNLETGGFNADFTGSLIRADQPVVVFSGSEASDAPWFETIAERQCCADHLEEQLDPIRTAGKHYVVTVGANRTLALERAGADIGVEAQREFFRVVAVTEGGAELTVTVPELGKRSLKLAAKRDWVEFTSSSHFELESDRPVMVGSISPSQTAANIPSGSFPGGDPSFMILPPTEQFRHSYVFLTPDKYVFDFIRVIAEPETEMLFDGQPFDRALDCDRAAGDGLDRATRGEALPRFWVYTCQLGFPIIDPDIDANEVVQDGDQNDGVHRLEADRPVGLLVDGFDDFVSYAYAGGTDLTLIVPE